MKGRRSVNSAEILRTLADSDEVISSRKISAELGITRAAVWKKIAFLRENGFQIQTVPYKGYSLTSPPDLSAEEISSSLRGDFWKEVVLYQEADSTNNLAASLALAEDFASSSVIIADMQKNGRGRLGRRWVSPPGKNIYMSIVLRPEMEPRDAALLTIVASLACARALRTISRLPVSIKWPNDLMVSGKKLGGILTELRSDPDKRPAAIIGIGINVNSIESDFPEGIRPLATSMSIATGRYYQRSGIIIAILREFEDWYKALKHYGSGSILEQWKKLSFTLGKNVSVSTGNMTVSGFAEDIDNRGMLILKLPSGVRKKISAGDLSTAQ